jgi:16S rRNA (guanine(527)-N(7))-methyltransferase RsmG
MTEAGFVLSERQADQFWAFHQFLRERNEALNMTRIYEFDAMVLKLYIDSALVGKYTPLPSPLLDIGTGPGFPGIPLAILHPEVTFLLSEGRHQRNQFLEESVKLLGLTNVTVLGHRIAPDFAEPVQGIVTRAVETIPETLERVMRALVPGGRAIFMKGPECDEELAVARKRFGRWYEQREDIHYRLLDTDNRRRLVIYERMPLPPPMPAESPVIQSPDNPRFRTWKSLLATRGVRKEGQAIASGRSVLEILRLASGKARQIVLREGMNVLPEAAYLPVTVFSKALFDQLDIFATGQPLLIVEAPAPETVPGDEAGGLPPRCLVLGIQDPAELGAALRTAAAFDWPSVVLTAEAAHPFHPKALAAGGAAAYQLPLFKGPSIQDLPPAAPGHYRVLGAGAVPSGAVLRLFLGPQDQPAWAPSGMPQTEISLAGEAALAAVLGMLQVGERRAT